MFCRRLTHVKNAVKMCRDMQLAEEAVRDEVLRGIRLLPYYLDRLYRNMYKVGLLNGVVTR